MAHPRAPVTEGMLLSVVQSLAEAGHVHPGVDRIKFELRTRYKLNIGRNTIYTRLKEWNIKERIHADLEERRKVTAEALASVQVAQMNGEIKTLNQSQQVLSALLKKALDMLEKVSVEQVPDVLKAVGQIVGMAEKLMTADANARVQFAEIKKMLPAPPPQPEEGETPAGPNPIDRSEMAEKYKGPPDLKVVDGSG